MNICRSAYVRGGGCGSCQDLEIGGLFLSFSLSVRVAFMYVSPLSAPVYCICLVSSAIRVQRVCVGVCVRVCSWPVDITDDNLRDMF